jgi:prepilin-type N-terminal cleavage/methylation domain-containing protein
MLVQRKRTQAFSLMELMIVVVITGVLAAIAIPTFITYVQKARTSEATQFLGVIKLKQEARRAEFGGYLRCAGTQMTDLDADAFIPGDKSKMKGGASLPFPANDGCFSTLGAKPDGADRFGYAVIGGTPSELGASGVPAALGLTTADYDHYFIAQALSDLDGDTTAVIFEMSNFTRNIYVMDESGNPLPAGWE